MFTRLNLLLIIIVITQAFAQKNLSPNSLLEMIPFVAERTLSKNGTEKSYPSVLKGLFFTSAFKSPRAIADDFLKKRGNLIGINTLEETLRFYNLYETLSGYKVRYQQVYKGLPVYNATVVVCINKNNEVVFVSNGYQPGIQKEIPLSKNITQSISIAKNYLQLNEEANYLRTESALFKLANKVHYVNVIRFVARSKNMGDWEFLVDAETGEIIQAKDRACYYNQGNVFDPDPITRSGATYGDSGFVDNGDEDSNQLSENIRQIDQLNITYLDGLYRLQSQYAQIVDSEAPFTGLHFQDSSNFFVSRSQNSFEAVNAFYHIDKSLRYINDTLGISVMPYQYEGGARFDPHGLGGADNSWYLPSSGHLAFGDGGVDDAEDQDVIVHELGHGIHDWITVGGLSNAQGLSEGSCDYWAQSYKRSKGLMSDSSAGYDWIFSWDGHNQFWAGRVSDYGGIYPDNLTGSIHVDGQIWSSALMQIYNQIGKYATDINFIEAISMLNSTSNQQDAALAFIQADVEIFEGQHLDIILSVFEARGYISSSIVALFEADITGGPFPLQVQFTSMAYSFPLSIISWKWDFQNDGIVDSYEENPQFIYEEAGLYSVKLTVTNGTDSIENTITDYISANAGIFVWEGEKHQRDNSGTSIYNTLNTLSLDAVYSNADQLPDLFTGYSAVFLSFGNYDNATLVTEEMVQTIKSYLYNGGRLFIEGADVFGDRSTDVEFLNLFGIAAVDNGEQKAITNLSGQDSSIFTGMLFTNSNQQRNFSIDTFEPSENGKNAFIENDYGTVAIQSSGLYDQKAVTFSYALAEMVDNLIPSSREDFVVRVLQYFDIAVPLFPRFHSNQQTGHVPLTINFSDFSFADSGTTLIYNWDFNNDNEVDSEEQNPQYTFEEPGHFDVKLTIVDSSQSVSTVYYDFIKVFNGESALNFNYENSYVRINADSTLNLTGDFTLEFWMKPTDWGPLSSEYSQIFDKQNIRVCLNKEGVSTIEHRLQVSIQNENGNITVFSTPDSLIMLNEWQHVAVIYNSADSSLILLINTEPIVLTLLTNPLTSSIADNSSLPIYLADSNVLNSPFIGALDEMKLWGLALTMYQIRDHWLNYSTPNEPALLGYWRFNEGNGQILTDFTINGNNGFINNSDWVEGVPELLLSSIEEPGEKNLATGFMLYPNYPNPFNPITSIKYQIPVDGYVIIKIYNILGQSIKTLLDKPVNAGIHNIKFNGAELTSGIYVYQLKVITPTGSQFKDQKKMLLIR